jgi:hypothetical protein
MPRNYVLQSDPEDQDFFPRFQAALTRMREQTGMHFEMSHSEDVDEDLMKYVFMDQDERGAAKVVDDFELETRYLEIEGESPAFERKVADALVPHLKVVPLAQLQREARARSDARHLKRLALGAGERADDETVAIVSQALASGDDERVAAGAEAGAILQWPELLPAIEAAAKGKHPAVTKRLLKAAADASRGGSGAS